jgi:TPR repeat protein
MPLFEQACSLGLTRGCANWGVQILRHQPSDAERDRAVDRLSLACDQSDAFACAELGDAMYGAFERSGASAHGRAHLAYERACNLGHVDACASDGWMFRNGEGTTKSARRARELFRFACERESYAGCAALGYDLIDDAKNRDEYAEGTRWLKLACDHDDAFGCFSMGAALVSSGDAANLDGGIMLLKRACSLGSADGCRFVEAVEKTRQYRAATGAPPADTDEAAASVEEDED